MRNQRSRIVGFFVGFALSCSVHGGAFLILYKNFIFKKEVEALHEQVKAPLKMALTAFVEEQQPEYQEEIPKQEEPPKKDEPKKEEPKKEEPPKPKLPEPIHHEIIKNEPVAVPVEAQTDFEETTEVVETTTTSESSSTAQTAASAVQAQNSGSEATAASTVEDDHIKAIIRAAIDKEAKKNYPSKAKKMHMEGVVTVKIKIDTNGNIVLLEITESTGFAMLDLSAIKSIEKASKNFPKPQRDLLFTLPISYELI